MIDGLAVFLPPNAAHVRSGRRIPAQHGAGMDRDLPGLIQRHGRFGGGSRRADFRVADVHFFIRAFWAGGYGPAARRAATMLPRCERLAPSPDIRVPSERNRDTDPSRQTPSPTKACRPEDTWRAGDCREDARSRKATFLPDVGEADHGGMFACESVGCGWANSHCSGGAPRRVSARQA